MLQQWQTISQSNMLKWTRRFKPITLPWSCRAQYLTSSIDEGLSPKSRGDGPKISLLWGCARYLAELLWTPGEVRSFWKHLCPSASKYQIWLLSHNCLKLSLMLYYWISITSFVDKLMQYESRSTFTQRIKEKIINSKGNYTGKGYVLNVSDNMLHINCLS
jgi:hypothetical protein